ncbi:MAG: LCP family protein, partial [Eubacterium sp.]|nr:LCP family protein [Eubacterium sp.]
MATPEYDLDDILNEIISKNVGEDMKSKVDEIDKAKQEVKEEKEAKPPVKEDEPKPAKAEEPPKAEIKNEPKPEVKEEPKPAVKEEAKPVAQEKPPVKEEQPKPAAPEKKAEPVKTEKPKEVKKEKEDNSLADIDVPFLESNREVSAAEGNESVSLLELGGYEREEAPKSVRKERKKKIKKKWRKTKAGKICISIILVLVLAIGGTGGYAVWYINDMLNGITEQDPNNVSTTTDEWKGMEELTESFDTINESEHSASYRDMVKKWYYNGEPASSSNVLNVMLIGEDTRGSEISDSGTRADSAIIGSLNTQTGEIVLTSILRDAYVYYETTPGDESTGRYGKINGAMAFGGVDCYINAVERMFKINIDNYVIVNFTSFQKIIDSLGGVTVTMTNAEIREINNHPRTYGNVKI